MSYLVLARKYRPRTFEEVIGQSDLTEVLSGAIRDERVGHAYLFCGPRGTGKTTTARIFAKALNCVDGPTATPCGVCDRCVAADAGHEVDIVEIDAASHTGVDYVRELREQAAYSPMAARYKVFIIDEVHMLSKSAFNALLKTLEEPPPHVKFLFATTEPQKLLDTVLSRCQILRLSPISEVDIAGRLDFVMDAEGFTPEAGVSHEVARLARGGMRDALSMTDQLIALAGTSPTVADVARLGGEGGLRELDALLTAVETHDKPAVLNGLPTREGGEGAFLGRILAHLRHALVVSLCGHDSPLLEAGAEERTVLVQRAERLGAERLQVWLEELLAARERMRGLPAQARLILEVALLDLARPGGDWPLAELEQRLLDLEARLTSGAVPRQAAPSTTPPAGPTAPRPSAPAPPRKPSMLRPDTGPGAAPIRASTPSASTPTPSAPDSDQRAPSAPAPSGATSAVDPQEAWRQALEAFAARNGAAAALLSRSARLLAIDGGRARIGVRGAGNHERQLLGDRRVQSALSRALSSAFGTELEAAFESAEANAPEQARPPEDEFTAEVAAAFEGVVERDNE